MRNRPIAAGGLWARMALSFGLLFSTALLLVELVQLFGLPVVGITGSVEERRQDTVQVLGRLAGFKREQLSRWLADRRINARLMASNQSVITAAREASASLAAIPDLSEPGVAAARLVELPSLQAAQRYMESVRTAYQSFSSIQLIDARSGRIVISAPKDGLVGADLSRLPLIIRGKEVGQKEVIDQVAREGRSVPALSIIRQVAEITPDGDSNLLGLMVFQFDLRQIITSSESDDAQILGLTGEILVVGADGSILARTPEVDAIRAGGSEIYPLTRLSMGGNEGATLSQGRNGQSVIAAFRYINIAPDIGWGLVVAQDEFEVLAPIHRSAIRWFGFGALELFAVLLLTGLISRRLTGPIRALSDAARQVKSGDFSARATPSDGGELRLLTETFNQMVERLGETHQTLEHLVEERTKSLTDEIANRALAEQQVRTLLIEKDALLNNGTVGIYMTENRIFTVCNRQLEIMLGYEPGKMLGQPVTIVYPSETSYREYGHILYSGLSQFGYVEHDALLQRKNGSTFWAFMSGRPLDASQPNGIIVWMMIDVSARRTAEAELALSQERYREIIEGTNAVVTTVDASGRFLFVNEAAAAIFGIPSNQCVGRLAFDFTHPDDREVTAQAFETWVSEHQTNVEFENRQLSESGSVHHLLWNIRIHYDDDGLPQRLTSIARETTELRRAQTALRLTQFSVDNAGEAVCWMDADCSILYANKAACTFFDRQSSQVFKLPLEALIGHQPAMEWRTVYSALGAASSMIFESEIQTTSRSIIHVEVTATKVTFDSYERNCAFFRDISVRKEAEERLIKSNVELEQFAFIASHDLREPLRMVKLYVALLERRMSQHFDEDTRTFMGFIVDGATRMDTLVNDLLEYSRVGRNITPVSFVDLRTAYHSVMMYLQAPMDECGGRIVLEGEFPTIVGDEGELVRLFQNLIGNAIKYRSLDRPLRLLIRVIDDNDYWRFAFEDNGIGISPEYHDKIFRVFQRLHAPGAHGGGTGIGLAICKKIVEHHHGRIWIESGNDHGAAFILTLPKSSEL